MTMRPLPRGLRRARITELANRLNSAAVHLLRRIARDDARDGITGARLSALSVIVYVGAQTTSQLARRERVSAPTITRIVDALVRDGLVRRDAVPDDRRVVRLSATARGRRLMERARARRIQGLARELEALTARDVGRLEKAIEVLLRLERNAEK